MKPLRLGVLASGRGTALKEVMTAIHSQTLNAQIAIIISNKASAPILSNSQEYDCPIKLIADENSISQELKSHQVDLILLVGYLRILSKEFVAAWQNKIINVHPSLLPAHAGLMNLNVHRAVLSANETITGCTVHYVTADLDRGPIILQETCQVAADDTPESLKTKVQELEGRALVKAIRTIISTR
jgi:phosphoribosylglycinamide formyltransferase-1